MILWWSRHWVFLVSMPLRVLMFVFVLPPIFVKMLKRDCAKWVIQCWLNHLIFACNSSSNGLCLDLSHFSEFWNFVYLVLVGDRWEHSSGFVITSSIHGSALTIFCSHGQCKSTFVSVSVSPRGRVVNINRLEKIQIFAVLLRPSVGHLRFSVLLIQLPPDCDSIPAIFDRCSSGVRRFPVISLPLGVTALFLPLERLIRAK